MQRTTLTGCTADGLSPRRTSDPLSDRGGTPYSPVFEDAADVLRHALFNAFTDRQVNALLEDSATFGTPTTTSVGESAFHTNTVPFSSGGQPWMMDGTGQGLMSENSGGNQTSTMSPNTAFLELFSAPGGILSQNNLANGVISGEAASSSSSPNGTGTTAGKLGAGTAHTQPMLPPPPQLPGQAHSLPPGATPAYPMYFNGLSAAPEHVTRANHSGPVASGLPPYAAQGMPNGLPPGTATYMTAYGPMAFAFAGAELPPPPPPPMPTPASQQTAQNAPGRVPSGHSVDGSGEAMLPQFTDPHTPSSAAWSSTRPNGNGNGGRPIPLHANVLGAASPHLNASGHAHSNFTPLSSVASNVMPSPAHASMTGGRPHNSTTHAPPPPPLQQQVSMSKSGVVPIPASPSKSAMNANITEVFDAEFRQVFEVPTTSLVHLPPSRLNITRLVLCRNYRAGERDSCAMSANCKFVHADCDYAQLPTHSIHVSYLWREIDLCTYRRVADDQTVSLRLWADSIAVDADNCVKDGAVNAHNKPNAMNGSGIDNDVNSSHGGHHGAYAITLRANYLLRTTGTLEYLSKRDQTEPLVSCEAYELDGICRQGEDCAFAHRIIIDPSAKSAFKRAPRRRHPNCSANTGHNSVTSSPQFSPQLGAVPVLSSARASPMMRARDHPTPPELAGQTSGLAVPPHPSPRRSFGTGELRASSGTTSKSGAGSVLDGNSGVVTPASSSLGVTSATTAVFGLKIEQWVQRAVRAQLLSTLPGVTNGYTPAVLVPNEQIASSGEEGFVTIAIPTAMAATMAHGDAIGTLLYVPRGSDHATVLGPVTAEDVLPSSQ